MPLLDYPRDGLREAGSTKGEKMAKVNIEHSLDFLDTPIIVLSKKKGAISNREAYEALEKNDLYGNYLISFKVTEDVPVTFYEEGDSWELYEVEDLLGIKAEEKYNDGYEDCLRDQCPEAEWGGNGRGKHMCSNCNGAAPGNPFTGERWHSTICPHCGARMKNGETI